VIKINQKGIAHLFILVILLVGLVIGVYLVQHSTHILPFASESSSESKAVFNKKVYLLVYDPVMANGQKMSEYFNWGDPYQKIDQIISFFQRASNSRVNYQVITQVEKNEFIKKADGFLYTANSYSDCVASSGGSPCHNPDLVDYYQFLNDPSLDICGKFNRGEIDELWTMTGPWWGFWESTLATSPNGPAGFMNTGEVRDKTSCNRLLPIMGFSNQTGYDNMIHDFVHRSESTINYVYTGNGYWDGWWNPFAPDSTLNKFALVKSTGKGTNYSGCGWAHFAPNAASSSGGQDSLTYVESVCDDYYNYPNLHDPQTVKKNINCTEWGCTITGFYEWWFKHIPHFIGQGSDGSLNDWWEYLMNPNFAFEARTSIKSPTPISTAPHNLRVDRNECDQEKPWISLTWDAVTDPDVTAYYVYYDNQDTGNYRSNPVSTPNLADTDAGNYVLATFGRVGSNQYYIYPNNSSENGWRGYMPDRSNSQYTFSVRSYNGVTKALSSAAEAHNNAVKVYTQNCATASTPSPSTQSVVATPTNVRVDRNECDQGKPWVTLTWDPVSDPNVTGYFVYWDNPDTGNYRPNPYSTPNLLDDDTGNFVLNTLTRSGSNKYYIYANNTNVDGWNGFMPNRSNNYYYVSVRSYNADTRKLSPALDARNQAVGFWTKGC
jgi:hypothetical protein